MAQRVRTDWVLFWVVVVLVCFGLVMVYSASSVVAQQKYGSSFYYIYRQLAWAVAGFVAMMALKRIDYRRLNNQVWAFGGIMLVLPLLVAGLLPRRPGAPLAAHRAGGHPAFRVRQAGADPVPGLLRDRARDEDQQPADADGRPAHRSACSPSPWWWPTWGRRPCWW